MGKGEIAGYEQFIFFPTEFLTLPKPQILEFSKRKEFADNKFRLNENGGKSYKRVENTVGKGEIARFEQFLLFPPCFQQTYTADT